MALIETEWATGQRATPSGCQAGDVKVAEFTYQVAAGATLAGADIVALGILPAFHHVVGATLIGDGLGAGITANVGFITGEPGSEAVGSELYDGADVAGATALPLNSEYAFRLPSVDYHRTIGIDLSGDVAGGGSGKKVTLVLNYAASSN